MTEQKSISNRRNFLGLSFGAGALLASGLRATRSRAQAGADIGRKFFADGRVRPFAGNTIVCHVPQQGAASAPFNALLDIYRAIPGYGFSSKLAWLPPSSYHMTVFGGANDQGRGRAGQWPENMASDISMDECNRILGERLKAFKLHTSLPIRMRFDLGDPAPDGSALKLTLLPYDEAENLKLRTLRDRLAEVLNIHSPTHGAYGFHISLGYWLESLDGPQQEALAKTQSQWRKTLSTVAPVIEFGAPEYCIFKDMYAFERQFFLT